MKKILIGALALCMAVTAIGCGGKTNNGPNTGPVNPGDIAAGTYNTPGTNKTTINVAVADMGLGHQWSINLTERFAQQHANTKFADNKEGVYVKLTQAASGISGYFDAITSNGQDIVFTEQGNALASKIAAGDFYPITEVVTDETREGGSIESVMFDKHKEIFKSGTDYYALPHAEFYGGMAYNRDVFERHNALIAHADCAAEYKIEFDSISYDMTTVFADSKGIGQTGYKLSAGPDGVEGNEDDGLPASIIEFVGLLEYFKEDAKILPIALSGANVNMVNYFLAGMWSSLAGQAQMESYNSLSGEIEVVKTDAQGNFMFTNEDLIGGISYVKKPVTEKITLTPDKAYLGNDMVAKYYALALAEIIQKEGFYNTGSLGSSVSHLQAQSYLINSSDESVMTTAGTTEAAMLIDGTYWINETTDNNNFENFYKALGYSGVSREDIDIRHMALPTSVNNPVAGETRHASTLMDICYGCCAVSSSVKGNQEKIDACMAFLKFAYSEAEIKNYTRSSRQFMALSYEFTEEELKELDPYYQSLWSLRDNKQGTNIVYQTPRLGTSAADKAVYTRAIGAIYTQLQSNNFRVAQPKNYNNVYSMYADAANVKTNGIYTYGSQSAFTQQRITASGWHDIYNSAV